MSAFTKPRPGRVLLVLLTALSAGLAPAAVAQVHPNHTQGFDAQKVYQLGDLENVNLFNGNLTLTLPIGGSYPVGGALSYGLTLTYTGNVWDFEEDTYLKNGAWAHYMLAVPRRRSNAGLGWLLSLGRIYPPGAPETGLNQGWQYESPDGALHGLEGRLHPCNENLYACPAIDPNVFYTQDGTYLRFKVATRELEFPDGTIQTFDGSWRLTQMRDRFGNTVSVTYQASTTHPGQTDWKLTDSHGRIQYVRFRPANKPASVVERVELAGFAGTTSVYSFGYADRTIARGYTSPQAITDGAASATETVTLLTALGLPDGSEYSMATTDYDGGPAAPATSSISGHLLKMKLPTGGFYEWTWDNYYFPTRSGKFQPLATLGLDYSIDNPFTRSVGVVARRHRNRSGALLGQWTYAPMLDTAVPAKEHEVTVTDPLGHPTTYYFSAYVDDDNAQTPEPAGWLEGEYGLPFTRNVADGTSPGRYLSSEIRDSSGTLKRTLYVRYERSLESTGDKVTRANTRLASERTVYHDDGNRWATTDHASFDGLGHYRTSVTDGNFDSGNVRTTTTSFNPGRCANPPVDCQPSTATAWVLGTYESQKVVEGGASAKREACFEAGTGFLLRTRTLKNTGTATTDPARSAADVLTVTERFTTATGGSRPGDVQSESLYGGDTQAVGTGALCGLALPATAAFRTDHTWQYGTLATSQTVGLPFKSLHRSIDKNTGLPTVSYDTALVATSTEFDHLGRLAYTKPAQDGWEQVVYAKSTASSSAQVTVRRRSNGGATVLAERRYTFDDLGRLWRDETLMPDGTWAQEETTYDGAGNVATVSTRGDTTKKTSHLFYDPFGRPGKIRPPDSVSPSYLHDVGLTYKGVREVLRTVSVGTGRNTTTGAIVETPSTTTERSDRQGRLYQVVEPANPDGTSSTTTYGYDVGSRLRTVSQVAKNGATTYTQGRTFTYDQRGFLLSETHPEKGATGNGTVTYASFDARGNPGRKTDGPDDLLLTYDKASRLTEVREVGTGGRVLQTFTYATSNASGNSRLGKLQAARTYNHPTVGANSYTVDVSETYTYGGKQGRVSKRDTSVAISANGGPYGAADTFTQSWTWNDVGEVTSLSYPSCTAPHCTAASPRTVSRTFTRGFLTAVTGHASSITYHPNGQTHQIVRSNGVTDTYQKDPYNLPRPAKIEARTTATSTLLWSTGAYAFDGAGNVTKNGGSYFLYDPVSRIKSGLLYTGPGGGGATAVFSHTFDGFGNLQSIATATTRSTPTSPTTNRLTGSVSYDAAGNLTSWNGATYRYDELDRMWGMTSGSEDWRYVYTADGERIFSFNANGGPSRWTLRDLDGRVLREYQNAGGVWSVQRDYVYRGRELLAAYTADATPKHLTHLHPDHLGTVRAVTDANGSRIAYHAYYPFGEEATAISQDAERMKFTGHERDLASLGSAADDLDYMHARFFSPLTGRFLAVDPIDSARMTVPQSWNKYGYALGNPVRIVDPDGRNPLVILVAAGVVGGLLFGQEAANTPESKASPMVENSGGMNAAVGASTTIATLTIIAQRLGFGTSKSTPHHEHNPQGSGGDPDTQGLEKQLRLHEEKLAAYKENPESYDNKGFLKNAQSEEQRQKIIDGRVKNLEKQVENFRRQIEERRRNPPME